VNLFGGQVLQETSLITEPGDDSKIAPDEAQLFANGLANGFCPVFPLLFNGKKAFLAFCRYVRGFAPRLSSSPSHSVPIMIFRISVMSIRLRNSTISEGAKG
jgi:hypothetical protein